MKFTDEEIGNLLELINTEFEFSENKPEEILIRNDGKQFCIVFNVSTISQGLLYYWVYFCKNLGYGLAIETKGTIFKKTIFILSKYE